MNRNVVAYQPSGQKRAKSWRSPVRKGQKKICHDGFRSRLSSLSRLATASVQGDKSGMKRVFSFKQQVQNDRSASNNPEANANASDKIASVTNPHEETSCNWEDTVRKEWNNTSFAHCVSERPNRHRFRGTRLVTRNRFNNNSRYLRQETCPSKLS